MQVTRVRTSVQLMGFVGLEFRYLLRLINPASLSIFQLGVQLVALIEDC